jgi:hypothetical protein
MHSYTIHLQHDSTQVLIDPHYKERNGDTLNFYIILTVQRSYFSQVCVGFWIISQSYSKYDYQKFGLENY